MAGRTLLLSNKSIWLNEIVLSPLSFIAAERSDKSSKLFQRAFKTSLEHSIGHVRLHSIPVCCHGNKSVTLGHLVNLPVAIGRNGACQSLDTASHFKSLFD